MEQKMESFKCDDESKEPDSFAKPSQREPLTRLTLQREIYLFTRNGTQFEFTTGKELYAHQDFPISAITFQTNQRLYISGGI